MIKSLQYVLAALLCMPLTWNAAYADDIINLLGGAKDEVKIGQDTSLTQQLRKAVGSLTAEQTILFNFIDNKEFKKAFYQWGAAFDGKTFERSATGQALKAYLFYKVGLEINGLEMLMQIKNPEAIHSEMVAFWKEAAPVDSKAWKLADFDWNPKWTNIFGRDAEVQVRSRKVFDASNYAQIEELLRKSKENTEERAWLEWQLALYFALNDDAGKGAQVLSLLMKEKQNFIDHDLMNITAARMLYEKGYLDAAIKYYKEVPKKSDYWTEAQEEMAWSYIRKGEPQNTMAVTKSLVHPAFKSLIGPETVFLRALSQLKVCDYQGVAQSLEDYKTFFRPKAANLQKLQTDDVEPIDFFYKSIQEKGRMPLKSLKTYAAKLPRYITRDEVLYRLAQRSAGLETESKIALDLYTQSLQGGTAKVGFQADIDRVKVATKDKSQTAKNAFYSRVKRLADEEVTEIGQILQKMHIVEAELLQQISVSSAIAATDKKDIDEKKGSTGAEGRDVLKFPASSEVWFDEISNFKIDVKKGCQISTKK
ncbi:MAG: hypothetical protein M9899_09815 [Bdellovibrionaceae bacterium]|nr:hypothetical protein [Pseudobdellovibrionaceae bacterium]